MPEFRLRQNGMTVAKVSATDQFRADSEVIRYAMQYRAEGLVTVERQHKTSTESKPYWRRYMLFEQWPIPADPIIGKDTTR